MSVSYDSIGQVCVTANLSQEIAAGSPVKFTDNAQVAPCADGDTVHGVLVSGRQGLGAVALRGFVTLPYSGTAPAVGMTALAAAGAGKVKAGGSVSYLVTQVDTANTTVTFLL